MGKIVEIPWDGNYKVGNEVETPEGLGEIVRVLPGPQKFHVEVPPPPKKASPKTIPRGTLLVNPDTGRIFGVIQADGTILEKDDANGGSPTEEKDKEQKKAGLEGGEEKEIPPDAEDDEGSEEEEPEEGVELILQPIYDKGEPTGEYLCSKCNHVWKPTKLPEQCPKCKVKETGE